jgi:16S rRNA (guanine1207-N2)-methyltransferase
MRSTRLITALESGLFALPDAGTIAVFGPEQADDLMALPKDRVLAITSFYPEHMALTAQGFRVATAPEVGHSAAVICLPRAKAQAHAMLAQAAASVVPGGLIIVDGAKTDGVEPLWRDLRGRVAVTETISKAHGRIFAFPAGPELAEWAAKDRTIDGGFSTRPGVFSADAPDRASVLLAAALPARMPGYTVDLGAGWGYLARAVLERASVKRVDLVEADGTALDCARLNVADARARFIWGDAAQFRADGYADHVVCNPPFHRGRAADPALGQTFIAAAARILSPSGQLWLVANRTLPYLAVAKSLFREVAEIGADPAFRLIHATHPVRQRPHS